MNIGILTSSDFPIFGAPESFVRHMALGLTECGSRVEVYRFWGVRYKSSGFSFIRSKNYLFSRPANNILLKFIELIFQVLYLPFFSFYCKFFRKINIIIVYGIDVAYICLPLLLLCKILNIKLFRTITEIYPEESYAYRWYRKPLKYFRYWQLNYIDRHLSGIIVLTSALSTLLVSKNVIEKKILLIPNFTYIENISLSKDDNVFRVGYCGTLSIENGVIDLIEAFFHFSAIVDNSELYVIGHVTDEISMILKNKPLEGRKIVFTGRVDQDNVKEYLSRCSILVNPRRLGILADTGFPTKIGEYFSMKLPVIATKVGDLPLYLCDHKEVFFAAPNDPIDLCSAMVFAFNNPVLSSEVAVRGNKWAIDNLDYLKNSRKLFNFLSQN